MTEGAKQELENLDIFELLCMQDLPEEEKVDFLQEMVEEVFHFLVERDLLPKLSERELAQFAFLSEKDPTKERVLGFLMERFPDLDSKIRENLLELKKELVVDELRERLDKVNLNWIGVMHPESGIGLLNSYQHQEIYKTIREKRQLSQALKAIKKEDWFMVGKILLG